MNIRHLAAGVLGLAALAGCRDTDPTFVDQGPRGFVRYVNASPDSPALVARLVDQPENWRNADGVGFRGTSGNYYGAIAGERRLRVFRMLSQGTLDTGTVVVLDTVISVQPQTYYTIVQTGLVMGARGTAGNTARVTVFQDTIPATVPTGQVQLRTYHAAQGVGNVDVAVTSNVAGAATAATLANVPFLARSAYAQVPVLTGTALYRFDIRPAGSTTALLSPVPDVPGLPATAATNTNPPTDATAGVRTGQSALSLFIFPAAVAGSPAATTATATPGAVLIADKQPPRTT